MLDEAASEQRLKNLEETVSNLRDQLAKVSNVMDFQFKQAADTHERTTSYRHIELDDRGVPIIAGTTMKVIELMISHLTYGWSPEELHFQYPHVGLSKIYSALAYYWDHQEVLDADIQRRFEFAEQLRRVASPSPIVAKLRTKGLLA